MRERNQHPLEKLIDQMLAEVNAEIKEQEEAAECEEKYEEAPQEQTHAEAHAENTASAKEVLELQSSNISIALGQIILTALTTPTKLSLKRAQKLHVLLSMRDSLISRS